MWRYNDIRNFILLSRYWQLYHDNRYSYNIAHHYKFLCSKCVAKTFYHSKCSWWYVKFFSLWKVEIGHSVKTFPFVNSLLYSNRFLSFSAGWIIRKLPSDCWTSRHSIELLSYYSLSLNSCKLGALIRWLISDRLNGTIEAGEYYLFIQ